jgi:VWFA-related protein
MREIGQALRGRWRDQRSNGTIITNGVAAYMKKFLSMCAFILAFALAASAQVATPKPTPPDDDVVKISTNLIQIDVSVTDKNGKAVTDLKPNEIEVYENGEKQKISNFSFVSSLPATGEVKQNKAEKGSIQVPVPSQTLRADKIRRTIALVVDDLSLSAESAVLTRAALKKFVDQQMQPGDLVAIIRTGAGIGALQQFTSDKLLLYAAIEKVKYNAYGTGGVTAFAPIEAQVDTESATATLDDGTAAGSGETLADFREQTFVTGTLGALRYIVTGMSELPGRKSVILFSDGFRIYESGSDDSETLGRVAEFLKKLVDLANRNSVVFYTVDARGLQTAGLSALDSPSDTTGEALATAQGTRRQTLRDTQEGLTALAEDTGGFAVLNNNDLSRGVQRVLEDQSYYLVAYEPDGDTFDAAKRKFNKLEVKVLRKGVAVRYRSGFFNVADDRRQTTVKEQTPMAQLETALVSPFAVSGIDLRLNALFGSDAKEGAYVRSLLHINAGDLKFIDEKDGTKQAVFDVLATSFGDNGQVVDRLAKTYTLTLKPGAYARVLANGFVYRFVFPVKKPGAYQYRVAIRDAQGGRVGSASQFIEVPDLGKNRLTASSIILENLTPDQWKSISLTGASAGTDPVADTALRRVKLGSVLRYGYEVYNAKLDPSKRPQLTTKIRVFREGELVLDGKQTPFDLTGQTDLSHLRVGGAVRIGEKLAAGDYILQVIVTDQTAKKIATQFVQFEVVP